MAIRMLYLIRHGEYDWDHDPGPQKGLTRLGARQAQLTAKRLRGVPATAIYCSDLARAVETAARIAAEFDGIVYRRLRTLRECWLPGGRQVPARRVIRAESRRSDAVFRQFVRPARGQDKHEIIVSHGNLIRYIVARVMTGKDDPHWNRMATLNCAVSQVVITPDGRSTLVSYNDTGHLPPHLVTFGTPTRKN
jgi:broad specificity phosphatase PhoE